MYAKRFFLLLTIAACSFGGSALALPVDWHGSFGVDNTLINNYNRVSSAGAAAGGNLGSQEVLGMPGTHSDASWQSYLLKLTPVLIVNDSASFKAELTSGYARGGKLGDDFSQSKTKGMGHTLYPYSFTSGENSLALNKFYMELYADTATYMIGRHSFHYGLGAVVNGGNGRWDRFSFTRDGITMNVRLGNFFISPFWSKSAQGATLTQSTRLKEHGISLTYKNVKKDFSFGILYSKRASGSVNQVLRTRLDDDEDETTANLAIRNLGSTNVTLTDLYFRKGFGRFNFALEVPLMKGSVGDVFSPTTSYKARAFVGEASFTVNPKWKMELMAGRVSGDNGSDGTFEAMYLNPNYQVAHLLFRYNLAAVGNREEHSVYDSYISNASYFRLGARYASEKWVWNLAVIKAKADQSTKAGTTSFNHTTGKRFNATLDQSNDLGMEVDLGMDYRWNHAIELGASLGLLFPGKYWAYTNEAGRTLEEKSSYAFRMHTSIDF